MYCFAATQQQGSSVVLRICLKGAQKCMKKLKSNTQYQRQDSNTQLMEYKQRHNHYPVSLSEA
jgi:hypothetical protein